MKEGEGIFIYKNGDKFEGIFKEEKEYEGNGYIYYGNGDKYKGHIKNGLKEGEGILTKKNGDKFEGIYNEDKEYLGINIVNNNRILIDRGSIELILDIKKEDINKEIQIMNYINNDQKEEREKNIDLRINDINIKYRFKNK